MKNLFNEYGVLTHKRTLSVDKAITKLASSHLRVLLTEDITPLELQAVANYFIRSISGVAAEVVLRKQASMRSLARAEEAVRFHALET